VRSMIFGRKTRRASEPGRCDGAALSGLDAHEEHLRSRFDSIAPFTVGAEEEFMLIDPETLALLPGAERVLAIAEGDTRLTGELRASQIETISPICVSVPDLQRELASVRGLLGGWCRTGRREVGSGAWRSGRVGVCGVSGVSSPVGVGGRSLTASGVPGASGVRFSVRSAGAECPAGWFAVESEHGEPGEVRGGGEQLEVGGDLGASAYAGAAAAVLSAHEVADLAFDLGTGLRVVGAPGRVGLPVAGGGELTLVLSEVDRAPRPAAGAPGRQRAARAENAEPGDLPVLDRP